MSKWTVTVSWSVEIEAEDEGDALAQGDLFFRFYREADAEEIEQEEGFGLSASNYVAGVEV